MVDGAVACAEPGVGADGFGDEGFGGGDRVRERLAEGEERGDGGGIGTAGAVGVRGIVANAREFVELARAIKDIEGCVLQVTAFNQHRRGAEIGDPASGFAHFGGRGHGQTGERGGFMEVRGDESCFGEQKLCKDFAGGGVH